MNREEAARILDPSTMDLEFEKDISHWGERLDLAMAMGVEALRSPQPDPVTGLVPCGCGGVTEQTDFHDGFFPYSKVECLECGNEIMRAGDTIAEAHDMAKMGWNISHGYAAPPRPGAIGPDAGEMAPNGDEGAEL